MRSEHVVTVHDVGETPDGTPFFVMTYANAGSAADLLGRVPAPSLGEVVDIIGQAADGLAALHANGTLHRDVTPQNLLLHEDLDGRRRVLVADLGVAKSLVAASGITRVVGTPSYMAPEQASGATPLDGRADVHALGAVAYHLLTGVPVRLAIPSTSVHASAPPAPSSIRPALAPLDDVVLRSLAPEPAKRWPDPLSFAHALADASTGGLVADPGVRRGLRGVAPFVWVVALAVLLVCFVIGYAIAT